MGALAGLGSYPTHDIAIAKTDWDLSATGDFVNWDAFIGSYPDDKFVCDYTGDLEPDAAGTSGHPIIFTGTITGYVVVTKDYIKFDDLTVN